MNELLDAVETIIKAEREAAIADKLLRISTYLMAKAKESYSMWDDNRAEILRMLSREFYLEAELVNEEYQKQIPERERAMKLIDTRDLEAKWKPLEWILTQDKRVCFSLEYRTLMMDEPQDKEDSKITIFELEGTGTYSFCRLEEKEEE